MRILVGDIGGTHTRLACWQDGVLLDERRYDSRESAGLDGPVRAWMDATRTRVDRAAFGVAGPVRDGVCTATNLPWVVDAAALTRELGVPVSVVNDFHAAARGVTLLQRDDWVEVVAGDVIPGAPVAVLGAGTGLGEALVVAGHVVAGEGGHCGFGPSTPRETRLAAWLIATRGRASWEDVLSGPGLVTLARFDALDTGGALPDWIDDDDAPARVSVERPDLMRWFAELYGAEAGNLALRALPRGGVWLCGGIAPRMLDVLHEGAFERAFRAKGKVAHALEGIPVRVVIHPGVALLGAAGEALLGH